MVEYDLEDRVVEFAVLTSRIVESLPSNKIGKHVAGQLLRSGTSAAPNYAEAQNAESRRDFIHKMKLCLKELRETYVWLKYLRSSGVSTDPELDAALRECDHLIRIFATSITTARRNDALAAAGKDLPADLKLES